MKTISEGNPSFVKDFKSVDAAVRALAIIVSARECGYSNKEIIKLDFFMQLFSEDFRKRLLTVDDAVFQVEVRIKNIARDLRKANIDSLASHWHFSKKYFDSLKRNSKQPI